MANFIDIICKNTLTGEVSDFGIIHDPALKERLLLAIDNGEGSKKDGVFCFAFEEFVFSTNDKFQYVDAEGKKRTVTYSEKDLKDYCQDLYDFLREQSRDFITYTHDIQYLIGALNASSVIKKGHEDDVEYLRLRMERMNLLTILISAKSAFFRFLTEDLDNTRIDDVSITGKTFKIHKGTQFIAETYRKTVETSFNSNSRSTVKMVDIFEFIPYSLVENAIKYGPKDLEVDFNLFEDRDDIRVSISSIGPRIYDDEFSLIFERGYRGKAIRDLAFRGHGLGLFQANRACKILFGGYIFAEQEKKYLTLNSIEYAQTNFTIVVPKTKR